jgi:hypothetical protein
MMGRARTARKAWADASADPHLEKDRQMPFAIFLILSLSKDAG